MKLNFALATVFALSFIACKKEETTTQPPVLPTQYFIKGTLGGKNVSATMQNPWDFELSHTLSGFIPLANPQDFAEIVIGNNTKYSPQDIEALKGDTLSFDTGKDRVFFVWNENGLLLNSNWATQPASSYFYISDVIAAGANASGFKKYALIGAFQCLTANSSLTTTQAFNQGSFAILVVETMP